MSNPMLATTNSNLDIRVKEPFGVVPPTSGVGPGSPDRFTPTKLSTYILKLSFSVVNISNNFKQTVKYMNKLLRVLI